MASSSASTEPRWKHWRLEHDIDHIAWLTLDHADEKVNSLGTAVLEELETIVGDLEASQPTGLVMMSGKTKSFIVGADVREFDQTDKVSELEEQIKKVHGLFQRIEDLPFPTVVAFEGYCLGGGLELALCFDWRIALDADHTRIGFPEVNLGIYPGFGGSGRSIQAAGGLQAMQIMLTGRMLRARAARAMNLINQTVDRHGSLRWSARQAVLKKKKARKPGLGARATTWGPIRKFMAGQMRKQTSAKARQAHYPAPFELIDAFEHCGQSQSGMIRLEEEKVPRLLAGDTSRNLRRVFRLMESLKEQGKRSSFKARRVHVIGAGVMGGDIAAWCASRGLEVTLQDREMKYIEPALKRAASLFKRKLKTPTAVAAAKSRLIADVEGKGVARADVIIEAIFENREAKRELFKNLLDDLQPHTLVATNTSAIPLAELSDVFEDPSRLIGLHFFNPVAKMPLVEIVYDAKSNPDRVNDGSSFATQIGKFALPVTSTPGFLVNRVLAPYMRNAMKLHREGVPKEALDKAAEEFGMPMGPVELADTVGLDVGLGVIDTLMGDEAGEDRKILEDMVKAGKLGKKSGQGFYRWSKGKPQRDKDAHEGHDLKALAEMLMKPYFDECQSCLADKVVENADLLDAGMIFGTGFAPFRGGPLHYLESRAGEPSTQSDEESS
ncbi:3-hydroxyacyl-CoA dehydrogenase NAD-binding domain-containing protein [Wenzhouxiangella marina]|uniref:enoyl-CoA hydratase n=1 Tax=Wenzhouxiangella marina TaxID=1579979 RepID=A0A0K0XW53_9GAMM|nr:3-hydroxyacyl-CoA dehydrogenase NAD-binding domain-containing protein [Wenzhouxiangella marina]AKS41934.1 3-hydroxyacyl-CoA dehydrogenase [Wenzhouxiangella marina]MBB6086299.1 3-hydroxyacyl-CoA dehydrogenase/enoyl-CoA hydratase/3-hydroxybutyryl-CoA epimerase [Wenzhouxiangella marina]